MADKLVRCFCDGYMYGTVRCRCVCTGCVNNRGCKNYSLKNKCSQCRSKRDAK